MSIRKIIAFLFVCVMLAGIIAACGDSSPSATSTPTSGGNSSSGSSSSGSSGGGDGGSTQNEPPKTLGLTVYIAGNPSAELEAVQNDIVSPWIKEKFGIYVEEIYGWTVQSINELAAQWAAAGNQPDVFYDSTTNISKFIEAGLVQPLEEFIPGMTNYNRFIEPVYWPWWEYTDGHTYSLPAIMANLDTPEFADDPFNMMTPKWALWVREDIAMMAGYDMTPIASLQADFEAGSRPKTEEFAFNPAIKTPEDFYQFLRKIKDLNLTQGGLPVYPFNIMPWMQWHVGCMFDFGYWQKNDDGSVTGILGSPGARDYYKFLKRLLDEELLDPDFLMQKDEQFNDKVQSGRVASAMGAMDPESIAKYKENIPGSEIRFIEWPKQTPGRGFFDVYTPGFHSAAISKKLPREDVVRLIEYFDWLYSDEGFLITSWGPEEAGLWEMRDGVRYFVDDDVVDAVIHNVGNGLGIKYWGLNDPFGENNWAKVVAFAPTLCTVTLNPFNPLRSYPTGINFIIYNNFLLGEAGMDLNYGVASNGDGGPNVSDAFGYFWSDFIGRDLAILFASKTEAEFDDIWDRIVMKNFEERGYNAAIADMEAWFDKFYVKKQ